MIYNLIDLQLFTLYTFVFLPLAYLEVRQGGR